MDGLFISPDRSDALLHLPVWTYDRGSKFSGRWVPFCGRDRGSDSWRLRFPSDEKDLPGLCSDCRKVLVRSVAAARSAGADV